MAAHPFDEPHVIGGKPSARMSRVAATSPCGSAPPYFTLIVRPSSVVHSNFGVVPPRTSGLKRHTSELASPSISRPVASVGRQRTASRNALERAPSVHRSRL